jgi:hypothetical protein
MSTPSNTNGNNTSLLLDVISQASGYGTQSQSYADLLSGFNHRSLGAPIPIHAEHSGITFFTRPNMNLSYDNLATDRILTPLLTDNEYTYQRVIRSMMDPIGAGLNLYYNVGRSITTPLFDPKCAFMPLLSNNLLNLSGWPDIALDTYTSHEGRLRENWSYMDGTSKTYTVTDLNATFRNVGGDPITLLLMLWATYMDHIHDGTMVPYLQSIMTNRVDYHTRIFRFTLDPTRTRIQKWSSAIGCFPVGVPIGAAMNYTSDNTYTQENSDAVATTFRAQIIEYLDPILFNEFNETVIMFNPEMADDVREQNYTKVPYQYLQLFNYQGYPHINVLTNELEWWVATATYQNRVQNFTTLTTAPTPTIATSTASQPVLASGVTSATAVSNDSSQFGWSDFLTDISGNLVTGPITSTDTGSNGNDDNSTA